MYAGVWIRLHVSWSKINGNAANVPKNFGWFDIVELTICAFPRIKTKKSINKANSYSQQIILKSALRMAKHKRKHATIQGDFFPAVAMWPSSVVQMSIILLIYGQLLQILFPNKW